MISPWWSWALAAFGLTGLWLAGSGRPVGWSIGVAAQLLWLTYGAVTEQCGFLLSAVAYGIVHARNWRRWRRRRAEGERPMVSVCTGVAADGRPMVDELDADAWRTHDGELHVFKTGVGRPVAQYAAGQWQSVRLADAEELATRAAQPDGDADGEGGRRALHG